MNKMIILYVIMITIIVTFLTKAVDSARCMLVLSKKKRVGYRVVPYKSVGLVSNGSRV